METVKCPKCPQFNEVKVSSGYNKPENKGKKYFTCIGCSQFYWVENGVAVTPQKKNGNGKSVSSGTGQQVAPPPPTPEREVSAEPSRTDTGAGEDPYAGLHKKLEELPALIATASGKLNQALFELDNKKLDVKREKSDAWKELADEDLTVSEKQARVDGEIVGVEGAEIIADRDMRTARTEYEKQKDEFDSVRKLANLYIAEYQRQSDSVKG